MRNPQVAYISIGNSDDKLTQADWHRYYCSVSLAIQRAGTLVGAAVHGQWVSEPASAWQNACWALQLPSDAASVEMLKAKLAGLAGEFRQDSIAWALAPVTEFIEGEAIT